MKTLIISIILTSIFYYSNGQSYNSFKISPPVNANQLNSDSVKREEEKSFGLKSSNMRELIPRYYYAVGDITVGYWVLKVRKEAQRSREQAAKELKVTYSGMSQVPPDIYVKSYNGISYVINKYQLSGKGQITFFSDYVNDQAICGVVKFDPADKQKAERITESLLNGIRLNN